MKKSPATSNSWTSPVMGFAKNFSKAQISAAVATFADFALSLVLHHGFGAWYLFSNILGSLLGAVINFSLGRDWVFQTNTSKWRYQAYRYTFTALLSFLINNLLVYIATDIGSFNFVSAKITSSVLIGTCFNYPMHRYFVFRA